MRLEAGDILVIPHGDPYAMSSAPGMRSEAPVDAVVTFFRQMATRGLPSVVTEGGRGPERADLVCGFLGCDVRPFNPVVAGKKWRHGRQWRATTTDGESSHPSGPVADRGSQVRSVEAAV